MDFNELKDIWKSNSGSADALSEKQLDDLLKLKRRSNISVDKLRRNNAGSLLTGFTMYVVIAGVIIGFTEVRNMVILLPLVSALLLVPLLLGYRFYKTMGRLRLAEMNFSEMLDTSIRQMESYVRFGAGKVYKYMLIPIALITGVVIGILAATGGAPFIETLQGLETGSILKIALVIILGSAITIPVSQKMMGRMFIRHLEDLKTCRKELHSIENQNPQ